MRVVNYDPKYKDDIIEMVRDFYADALHTFDNAVNEDALMESIEKFGKEQAFLMIKNDKCVGVLTGFSVTSLINKAKVFQEVLWYVHKDYRRYGVKLLRQVERILKKQGYTSMVMALMHGSMPKKLHDLYTRMGFKPFETHYIKGLQT